MLVLLIKNVILIYIWISVFKCTIIRVNSLRSKNLKGIFIFKHSVSYRSQLLHPSTRNTCFIHHNGCSLLNPKECSLNTSNGDQILGLFESNEENFHDREYNFPVYEKKWQRFWEDTKLFQTHDPDELKKEKNNDYNKYVKEGNFEEKKLDSNNGFFNSLKDNEYLTHLEDSINNQNKLEDIQSETCNVSTLNPGRGHLEQTVPKSNNTISSGFVSEDSSVNVDSYNSDHSETVCNKPKYYILSMIPYPSGKGLHVGHLLGYTAVDVIARYKRFNDFNVLNPIGFDCFGIPTEVYSEKVNKSPEQVTKENITNFRNQLKSMGFSFDFTRELITSDPSYYKWTQWIFQQMFLNNLAYKDKDYVNYCPGLGSELSNEEVKNGKSVRGDFDVFKRLKTMWKLRITEYAKRLYDDLMYVDYPERLVNLQKNWINPRKGYLVKFMVYDPGQYDNYGENMNENQHNSNSYNKEELFINRKYLYGFVEDLKECGNIESIEVPVLLENIMDYCSYDKREEIKLMLDESLKMSNLELSMEKNRRKLFSGLCVINPYNKNRIPIYVTNALINTNKDINCKINSMENDDSNTYSSSTTNNTNTSYEEETYNSTEEYNSNSNFYNNNSTSNTCYVDEYKNELDSLNQDYVDETKDWYKEYMRFNIKDWVFSRNRGWGEPIPILYRNKENNNENNSEVDNENGCITFKISGRDNSNIDSSTEDYNTNSTSTSYEEANTVSNSNNSYKELLKELPLVLNSNITETMPQWAGSCWHYLRFVDPKNTKELFSKKLANYWLPVDLYIGGVEHAVSHLLYSRFWNKFLYDINVSPVNEPFKKILLHGVIKTIRYYLSKSDYEKLDFETKLKIVKYNNKNENKSNTQQEPNHDNSNTYSSCNTTNNTNTSYEDEYEINNYSYCGPFRPNNDPNIMYNNEYYQLPDVFHDKEEVEVPEDIVMKYKNKYVISKYKDIELKIKMKKMSKSRGNVISPEEITKKFGSDALRLHLMFLGPIDKDKVWSVESIRGVYRLLKSVNKLYRDFLRYSKYMYYQSINNTNSTNNSFTSTNTYNKVDKDIAIEVNRFIDNVTYNMENIKLNKISEFFEFLKLMQKWHQQKRLTFKVLDVFLIMFNPFAPHLTEHLWYLKYLHKTRIRDEVDKDYKSISLESWPTKFDVT